jgi:hypothetical protein
MTSSAFEMTLAEAKRRSFEFRIHVFISVKSARQMLKFSVGFFDECAFCVVRKGEGREAPEA